MFMVILPLEPELLPWGCPLLFGGHFIMGVGMYRTVERWSPFYSTLLVCGADTVLVSCLRLFEYLPLLDKVRSGHSSTVLLGANSAGDI